MKLKFLYNHHHLLLFLFVICLHSDRYNCEEKDKQKLENYLDTIYAAKRKPFAFSSYNGIPWHVESDENGEVIVPDKFPNLKNIVKRSFISNISDEIEKTLIKNGDSLNFLLSETSPEGSTSLTESPDVGILSGIDNNDVNLNSDMLFQPDFNNPKMLMKNLDILLNKDGVAIGPTKANFSQNVKNKASSTKSSTPTTNLTTKSSTSKTKTTKPPTRSMFNDISRPTLKHIIRPTLKDISRPTVKDITRPTVKDIFIPTLKDITRPSIKDISAQLSSVTGPLSKQDCENQFHRSCICSFKDILSDFESILSKNPERKVQTGDIVNYQCKNYIPVPEHFALSSDLKPKVLAKNKGLVIDDGNGPKEINEQSIQDLMSYGLEDEGSVIYAFPNTNLVLPCFPSEDIHLSGQSQDTNYTWTHGSNKIITDGRIIADIGNRGRLTVHTLSPRDTDNYTCTVQYVNPDSGHYSTEKFVHQVIVVSVPLVVLHAVVHYKAQLKCDESILQMFELYLPQQLEQLLCGTEDGASMCDINVYNPLCHTESLARFERDVEYFEDNGLSSFWRRQKRQAVTDSMEMSLSFEVQVHKITDMLFSVKNTSHCNPLCQQKVYLKLIQLIKDSFPDILPVEVTSSLGSSFHPVTDSIMMKYIAGCNGGYELIDGFCTPCKENFFSQDGATGCTPCPRGMYQNQVGSRSCIACTNNWIPACNAFTEEYNLQILLAVVGAVIFLLVGFTLVYICCIRDKAAPNIDTFSPYFTPTKGKKNRAKLAKSARYQKKQPSKIIEETSALLSDDSELQNGDYF